MAEAPQTQVWVGRSIWLGLMLVLVFLHLLPLDTVPRGWAPPDLMLAVTLVWVARRPDFLPVLLIAGVFLLADLVFMRPPGLHAALVVLLTEALRRRASGMRTLPFVLEWIGVGVGIAAIAIAYRTALALTLVPQPPVALTASGTGLTILCYPLVTLAAHLVFGVRRPAPGEVDSLGHRI